MKAVRIEGGLGSVVGAGVAGTGTGARVTTGGATVGEGEASDPGRSGTVGTEVAGAGTGRGEGTASSGA